MGYKVKWNAFLDGELRRVLLGKQLGQGVYRKVFECRLDPTLVVKVEDEATGIFCNVLEWQNWVDWRDVPNVAKWLAPCVSISPNGAVLLMKKATKIGANEVLPSRLPHFISADLKAENFGWFEGRLVKVDYPGLRADLPKRLTKVDWSR